MLELKKVSKFYGSQKGVSNLSVKVKKGTMLGFLGSNGSGKTTTFRILLGLLEASEGTILYDKKPIESYPSTLMGYLPEERSLLRNLKVAEQIRYLARLKQMDDRIITDKITKWLEALHMEQYRNRRISELSKGNQQKVQLICALIHDPNIIIFDEPLNGLDLENVQLFQKIVEYLKQQQKIILISSHQYETVEQYCDSVLYLYHGDVIFQGNLMKLKQKSAYRMVTFPAVYDNEGLFEKGVLTKKQHHSYVTYVVKNEDTAAKMLKQLMRDGIYEIQVTLPSLRDLIQEHLYEGTH